MMEDNRQKL